MNQTIKIIKRLKAVKIALWITAILCVTAVVCLTGCNEQGQSGNGTDVEQNTNETPAGETDAETAGDETETTTEVTSEAATEAETKDPYQAAARETADFDATLNVTENGDGTAKVVAATGLTYTVSGYKSLRNGRFVINEGCKVTLEDGAFADDFNRIKIAYACNQPLHIFVTYTVDGADVEDDFYLEAGKDLFCGLILNFTKSNAKNIKSMTVKTCNGQDGQFALCGISTEIFTNPAPKTYYIESDRYKLGLCVTWGWTINYLSDNQNPIAKMKNIINQHDSGRLVQQSYYGTRVAQGDFVPGKIGSENWMYNPVQAGDYTNHGSRVVDVVLGYRSVYVKIQPYDWGQSLWLCPAYMENVYTVGNDYIRVDNRYTEFSNYDNPQGGQELPAFYTVSYFNEFAWYDGDKPWTNDKISYNKNIEMVWTSTEHLPNFGAYTKIGNTETWCALFSREDNYGIGMFVPNVDYRSVGVYHPDERTMQPTAQSTSYMGASRAIQLVSYQPLEYSYLIACGSVEEIRAVFAANRDFADNKSLDNNASDRRVPGTVFDYENMDFTNPDYIAFVTQTNTKVVTYAYDEEEQALRLTTSGEDPYFSFNFMNLDEKLNASDFTGIEIEYMVPTENSGLCGQGFELFLSCGTDVEAAGGKSVKGMYVIDDLYHTVTVDFSKLSFWDGQINKIRLDFFNQCQAGDTIYIKSVRLVK